MTSKAMLTAAAGTRRLRRKIGQQCDFSNLNSRDFVRRTARDALRFPEALATAVATELGHCAPKNRFREIRTQFSRSSIAEPSGAQKAPLRAIARTKFPRF
jgi:hypothetical protein